MRHRMVVPFLCASAFVLSGSTASAQFIGTFNWLTSPYCNVVTLNVTQVGSAYAVEGFDNLCGATRVATVTGAATLNPDGTVGIGLTIVNPGYVQPSHLDVLLNIATLAGTWEDGADRTGPLVPNGVPMGEPRPLGGSTLTAIGVTAPAAIGRRARGSPAAPSPPQNFDTLLDVVARGFDGTAFSHGASIAMRATENWTSSAQGARIFFFTNENGTTGGAPARMTINHDGRVGIGTGSPDQRLDVFGNVRVGTGMIGCVQDRDATVIAGNCGSDARFKRDVVSFQPMLSKVAALRPVHFYWRAGEFPERAFGDRQSYGLIAQEVEAIFPALVTTDAEGYKAVNYSKLPLLAIQAIKDLTVENDSLRAQLALIERRLASLEAERR